jgi:hypothetical protein
VDVRKWDFCELDVWAYHFRDGALKVQLQPRYP